VKYLAAADINTDEEVFKAELERVRNISVFFSGKKINEISWIYGKHADDNKEYIMIQFDADSFHIGEKDGFYIFFQEE